MVVTLEVHNPTGAVEMALLHASRLDSPEGKTICELSDVSSEAQSEGSSNPRNQPNRAQEPALVVRHAKQNPPPHFLATASIIMEFLLFKEDIVALVRPRFLLI